MEGCPGTEELVAICISEEPRRLRLLLILFLCNICDSQFVPFPITTKSNKVLYV